MLCLTANFQMNEMLKEIWYHYFITILKTYYEFQHLEKFIYLFNDTI